MGAAICETCGATFTFDVIPRRGKICFKCHLGGISIGFSHGKETFHGPTFGERQREIVDRAKETGREVEPVGARWV
jgi:hypothetical protein